MKVLFITEPYVIDPIGIAYLSAALKKDGHEVSLLRTVDITSIDPVVEACPDILAYSIYTGRHKKFAELNRSIRSGLAEHFMHPISIFGGPHATFFRDFVNEPFVDIICQGEFDLFVSNVFTRILNGGIPLKSTVRLRQNPQDLDLLPFPDRGLIYQFQTNRNNPIKNIMTSRGCPFSCPYCYNSVIKKMFSGKSLRYRSIDSVVEEALKLVGDYPETKYIFFVDDEFIGREKRLHEFSEKWMRQVAIPFHAQLRIDFLTEGRVDALKAAGCTSVTFAIESGNEKIRKGVLHRKISNRTIYDAAHLLHKKGISFRTENMLALPNETVDEALETLDLNMACKPKIGWSSLFQPYPKTALGVAAVEQGLFDGNLSSIPSTFFEKSVLNINDGQKRRFENLQRLFGLICDFPFLRFFARFLISMPRNRFYDLIYSWHKRRKYNSLFDWTGISS